MDKDRWINSKDKKISDKNYYISKLPLFICAPIKDMNTQGYKKEGVFLMREIPDPIVLHPMLDGCLIVSKWGLGSDDENLINEKMN
jgi:hypothetical protein